MSFEVYRNDSPHMVSLSFMLTWKLVKSIIDSFAKSFRNNENQRVIIAVQFYGNGSVLGDPKVRRE